MRIPSEGELLEIQSRATRLFESSTDENGNINWYLGVQVSEDVERLADIIRELARLKTAA